MFDCRKVENKTICSLILLIAKETDGSGLQDQSIDLAALNFFTDTVLSNLNVT